MERGEWAQQQIHRIQYGDYARKRQKAIAQKRRDKVKFRERNHRIGWIFSDLRIERMVRRPDYAPNYR